MSDSPSSKPQGASQPVRIQSISREPSAAISTHVSAPVPAPAYRPEAVAAPVPMPVDVNLPAGPTPYEPPEYEYKKPNVFSQYWRKVGGGSLMVSLLIHAGLLIGAVFIVQTIVVEPKVDFLPGGGSKSGADASQAHTAQVQQKKRNSIQKTTPMRKVVSNSSTATMSLPDLPMDTIDMPEVSSMLGGAMSSGGFGGGGFGGGSGAGFGSGNVKGFLARTVFGNLGGGEGLPGVFYDLKQNADRKPLDYTPNNYPQILKEASDKKFSASAMKGYYRAAQQMSFSFLAIPYMSANEGPKAFQVDKEVEPRGWFVHYSGTIIPPEPGEWRFVGNFDDALAVYINDKCVLDASWFILGNLGERKPDPEIRQSFGSTPVLTNNQRCHAGKWVRLNGPAKIDIIVGERPGGSVGGVLLVENKRTKYKKRPDGTPILPVFTTIKPDVADLARMQTFVDKPPRFELEMDDIPVFKVSKSAFDPDQPKSNLLPRRTATP